MKNKLLLTVSLLLLATAVFPQGNSNTAGVVIHHGMAFQGAIHMFPTLPWGAPVRVFGTTMGDNALMTRIKVTNYSSKNVSSIQYGWRISAPPICGPSTLPVRWDTATVGFNRFAPGDTIDVDTPESLSRKGSMPDLAKEASASGAHVVLVTVGIVKVTFADGSTWTDDEAVRTNNFDSGLHEKQENCHVPTVSEMQRKTS